MTPLLTAITSLYAPVMLHAIAVRAGTFWLAYALTWGFWIAVFSRSQPVRIWQ